MKIIITRNNNPVAAVDYGTIRNIRIEEDVAEFYVLDESKSIIMPISGLTADDIKYIFEQIKDCNKKYISSMSPIK
jgi:hypothetical protein